MNWEFPDGWGIVFVQLRDYLDCGITMGSTLVFYYSADTRKMNSKWEWL